MKDYNDICADSPYSYISNDHYEMLSFKQFITERLKFTTRDDFKLQLKANRCDLLNYSVKEAGDRYILRIEVLDKYASGVTIAEKILTFNRFLEKYSYRFAKLIRSVDGSRFVEIVPENDTDSPEIGLKNLYIHLSKIDNLDSVGMIPKQSTSIDANEVYDFRMFLFPVQSLLDGDVDIDDENAIFLSIYNSAKEIVEKFNSRRGENERYWVYLVNLQNQQMPIYRDPMFLTRRAVYVKNPIKSDNIDKIGRI